MSAFWESHKHKFFGMLIGMLATLAVVASNMLCSRLGPAFAPLCVSTVAAVADAAKVEAARQSDAVSAGPVVDLSKPVCDEAHCLSNGYALALEDGGSCRCPVAVK